MGAEHTGAGMTGAAVTGAGQAGARQTSAPQAGVPDTVRQQMPIAIVGMGALFPGAPDLTAYRDNVLGGVDAITDAPAGRWDASLYHPEAVDEAASADRIYCRRGGFISTPEVSVARFGMMPASVAGAEPDQLLALEVAAATIADAGGLPDSLDRSRVGIVLGRGGYMTPGMTRLDQRVRTANQLVATLGQLLPDLDADTLAAVHGAFTARLGPDQPESAIGLVPNLAASRVANRLDLRGPAYTVDAACASSLIAVDHAVHELESGRCDLVLAGGVHHAHDITLWSVFAQLRALSTSERSRPFDADSDGILIGEGTGMVALKRLDDALRDGDRVYAVVRGTGVASDGRTASLMNPDPGGQTRAVRAAWSRAGIDPTAPESVGLIEAHGTGTPAGDTAELHTLGTVFGALGDGERRAVVGSVKSMIGHAMPAAGVAGLIKATLALYHGVLPPTLGVATEHPDLASTRFGTTAGALEWPVPAGEASGNDPGAAGDRGRDGLRRAGVNAFGFGGINAHVVIEQLAGQPAVAVTVDGTVFDVDRDALPSAEPRPTASPSVRRPEEAAAPVLLLAAATVDELERMLVADDDALIALAGTAPGAGPVRLGIVDPTPKRLALARKAVGRGRAWHGRSDVWFRPEPLLDTTTSLAYLFPGLEAEFAPRTDDVATHFGLSSPLASIASGDAATGDITSHGSAVLQVSRLLAAALDRLGVEPDALAGHSVGEWSAMVVGGIFDGRAVDEFIEHLDPSMLAITGLAFAVIGAPASTVLEVLAGREDVVLSHDNAPNQSMICGPDDAVDALVDEFRARGVLSRGLPFSSGFHTPFFERFLAPVLDASNTFTVSAPALPVYSATTVAPFPDDEATIRDVFVRHLLEPVRFRQVIERMYAEGTRVFVQLGPGQLGTLVSDTLHDREHLVVSANASHRSGLDQLRCVIAALWASGREVDLEFVGVAPAEVVEETAGAAASAPAPAPAPGAAAAARGPVSRLDLDGAFVHLEATTAARLAERIRPVTVEARASVDALVSGPGGTADRRLGATGPLPTAVASQLDAFLGETETLIRDLLSTERAADARAQAPLAPEAPTALATPPAATPLAPAPPAPPAAPPASVSPAPAAPAPAAPVSSGSALISTVDVGIETMPHLLDHCFFQQRDDWPDVSDRFPVVPGTTIVRLLMDAAESSGRIATAVHSVRLNQWVDASEPSRVEITGTVVDDERIAMSFGPYAHATIELAPPGAGYPRTSSAVWAVDPSNEREPRMRDASQLYSERWMFHGPRYQGVTAIHAIGDAHVRGTITTPAAPGSLLDNVGQLLGYWLMAEYTERTVVFPVGMQTIRFFGADPVPGDELECTIRITAVTDTVLQADVQLTRDGHLWCEITGWQDRRFDNHPTTRPVEQAVYRNTLSVTQPEGWTLLVDRWPDLASRDLIMRNHLSRSEREAYLTSPPRGRRQWLLGRIATKDAARALLWGDRPVGDRQPLYPAEFAVDNLPSGQPRVSRRHGREFPAVDTSIAHSHEIGVSIVRAAGPGVGIDVEAIAERPESMESFAMTEGERAALDARRASASSADAAEPGEWITRFWSAKEAVGKALGTGLDGRPRDFEVVDVGPLVAFDRGQADARARVLRVRTATGLTFDVGTRVIANPVGLPERRYVVAWTYGAGIPPFPDATATTGAATGTTTRPHGTTQHGSTSHRTERLSS